MPQYRFKICIFGDGAVGKTALTQRFMTGIFEERYQLTIGTDFYLKKLNVEGNEVSLQIWDFAGEEKFRFMMDSSVIGAQAAIFMYDITRFKTLENLKNWLEKFHEINEREKQNVPLLIAGSKLDLAELRTVQKEDGLELARENNAVGWIECSSKTGEHVEELFEGMARYIIRTVTEKKKAKGLNIFS